MLKDLVVDMEPFFDAYRAVKPFLITHGHGRPGSTSRSQTDRARFDDTTKCILCAACTIKATRNGASRLHTQRRIAGTGEQNGQRYLALYRELGVA